jgi:hypothetical protein
MLRLLRESPLSGYTLFLAASPAVRFSSGCSCGELADVQTKRKGLRHWLRSSRQLLRGSQQRGCVHRRSPLMRSPLLRFQAPAAPRRAAGFFGFGRSMSRLIERITQPTSGWSMLIKPILSASATNTIPLATGAVNASFWCIPETGIGRGAKASWQSGKPQWRRSIALG